MTKKKIESIKNPIDVWAAIQQMRDTKGWKLLMERYGKEGDVLMSEILDTKTPNKPEYGKRDLCVFQLEALGRLAKVIGDFENEAKGKDRAKSQPKHIGV